MKSEKRTNILFQVLFILYMVALCYLLFFSSEYRRSEVNEEYHYNLVLFREIRRFFEYREVLGMRMLLINVVGNVVVFIPLGFFLPLLEEKLRKIYKVVPIVFGFSLIAELIQLVYKVGTFDVDDLLLNTVGGFLGYVAWRIADLWHRKRQKR